VTFHFTPTRASWLNQVECWFSILQGQSLNGASFTSVDQVKKHIDAFIKNYNEDADLTSNRIARVLFCFSEGRLLALHGFIKKTQKTPDAELALARKRMGEFK
jgi:phage-related protein